MPRARAAAPDRSLRYALALLFTRAKDSHMDVEEYVRRGFRQGISEEDLRAALANQIRIFKPEEDQEYAARFAQAVINEVKNSTGISGDFFTYHHSGVSMGEFGVGSRGSGDFFAHRQIARVIGRTRAAVGVDEMDDGGVVEVAGKLCPGVNGYRSNRYNWDR